MSRLEALQKELSAAMQKLCKWRMLFCGKWMGTASRTNTQAQCIRDVFSQLVLVRAEVNAITKILVDKKVVSHEEFCQVTIKEVELLDESYKQEFPGFESTSYGVQSTDIKLAAKTTEFWPS